MRPSFYRELIKFLQRTNNLRESINPSSTFNIDLLNQDDTNEVTITVKDYQLPQGLSSRLNGEMFGKDFYEIKGPMGRGLGLTKDSTGKYIAFAAGTGVLVFVDLVARMSLAMIDAIPNEEQLHRDFSLELFVSF